VSLSFSNSPFPFIYFFFIKITEQHQHLFFLKPTPSSAGRPTKTEANHFLFLSFIRIYAHNTRAHIYTNKAFIRTSSRSYRCVRARFSIAVSLTFGKMDALRFVLLLHSFILLNISFFLLWNVNRIIPLAISFDLAFAKRCPIKFLTPPLSFSSLFSPLISLYLTSHWR